MTNKNFLCLMMLFVINTTVCMDEPTDMIPLNYDPTTKMCEIMISDTHTCTTLPVHDARIIINQEKHSMEMVSAGEIKGLEKGHQINFPKGLVEEIMTKKRPFYFCTSHEENNFTPVSCTRITQIIITGSTGKVTSTQLEDSLKIAAPELHWIPSMNMVALYITRPFFIIYHYLFKP